MVTADSVLDVLTGQMTAQQVAERLGAQSGHSGLTSAADVLPVLNDLAAEGRVARRVNPETSIARWSRP